MVAAVRARPEIEAASAREAVMARVTTGHPVVAAGPHAPPATRLHAPPATRSLQLFVADDLETRQVTVVRRLSGAWPPPPGTMLLERTALAVMGAGEGDTLTVTTPHGQPQAIAISGVVHDTALAPAWQEHRGYGYITRDTLAALGEPARAARSVRAVCACTGDPGRR